MDFDSDSGDFDADYDDADSDYEYDEDGDAEMEFETEADESEDYEPEDDPDQDIEYDLADQSVESTSTLYHMDSNDQENWYYVETDQDDQVAETENDDSDNEDKEAEDDQPESENVTTATEPMTAQQKQALEIIEERSSLTVATGGHNRDKREWYSRQEYHYEDYDEDENDEDEDDQDTPLKRLNRLIGGIPKLFFAIPPEEDDYE